METVEQIMTKDILTIDSSKSLPEVKEIFDNYSIRHLPVISKNKLVGMLSKTDIMRLSFGDTYGKDEDEVDAALFNMLTIEDVMTRHPRVISPTDSINDVAEILIKEEFHALPVSDNGELKGIITTTDIIKYQLSNLKVNKIPKKYLEQRPWGDFEQFCQNLPCTVKIINVNAGEELSLQYHEQRIEFWKVIQGEGIIVIGEKEQTVRQGDEFTIPAKTQHQIKTEDTSLQVLEISFGNFDEKDIVRLTDKYQRGKNEERQSVLT